MKPERKFSRLIANIRKMLWACYKCAKFHKNQRTIFVSLHSLDHTPRCRVKITTAPRWNLTGTGTNNTIYDGTDTRNRHQSYVSPRHQHLGIIYLELSIKSEVVYYDLKKKCTGTRTKNQNRQRHLGVFS